MLLISRLFSRHAFLQAGEPHRYDALIILTKVILHWLVIQRKQPNEISQKPWWNAHFGEMMRWKQWDDAMKTVIWPAQITEMSIKKQWFHGKFSREFLMKPLFFMDSKLPCFYISLIISNLQNMAKKRDFSSWQGLASENCSHKGGKMSVYPTKKHAFKLSWSHISTTPCLTLLAQRADSHCIFCRAPPSSSVAW